MTSKAILVAVFVVLFILLAPATSSLDAQSVSSIQNVHIVGDPIYYPGMGDLWMPTWGDDDRLYLSWGDGTGFGDGYPTLYPAYESPDPVMPAACGEMDLFPCELWCNMNTCDGSTSYPRAPLTDAGVLAFEGQVPDFEDVAIVSIDVPSGEPFFIEGPGGSLDVQGRNDKPSSLLFVDGRLYLAGHAPAGDQVEIGYIAHSDDYGQTWTEVPDTPWSQDSHFRVLMFINMGQNYSLNQDGYVYALGIGTEAEWTAYSVYLTRVPTDALTDYTAFEYFTGMDGDQPRWSSDEAAASPVDTLSTRGQASAMYHEGTGRYLFLTTTTTYEPNPDGPFGSGALFEAPNPWGPWTKAGDLCFVPECDDGSLNVAWTETDVMALGGAEAGKYIAGLIPKGTGPNHVYFTIAGGGRHYQLQIGRLEWDLVE